MHGQLAFGDLSLDAGSTGFPVADLDRDMSAAVAAVLFPTVDVQPRGAGIFADAAAGGVTEVVIGVFQGMLKTGNAELESDGGYDVFIARQALSGL